MLTGIIQISLVLNMYLTGIVLWLEGYVMLISILPLLGGSHKHLFGLLCNMSYLGHKVADQKKFKTSMTVFCDV